MTTVTLQLDSNIAYSAEQVENRITLSDLLELVEAAIETYGPDAEIVTEDKDNRYGAGFGRIRANASSNAEEVFTREIGLDDECDICGGYIGDNKSDAVDNGYDIGHDTECPNNTDR